MKYFPLSWKVERHKNAKHGWLISSGILIILWKNADLENEGKTCEIYVLTFYNVSAYRKVHGDTLIRKRKEKLWIKTYDAKNSGHNKS